MTRFFMIVLLFSMGIGLCYIPGCDDKDDLNPSNGRTTALFNPDKNYGTLSDQDGNVYKTITIGSQTWMAENLRTTRFRNGDLIPEVADIPVWFDLSSGAQCTYQNTDNPDSIATYGRLYNWFVVNDPRNIAPAGWHVPTLDEWNELSAYLTDSIAAIKLKEAGTRHWKPLNNRATNESGFTALGSGYRQGYGGMQIDLHWGIEAAWWTVTVSDDDPEQVFHVTVGYNYDLLGGCYCDKNSGYSIRCMKD